MLFLCLIGHVQQPGAAVTLQQQLAEEPVLDLKSGYVQRALPSLPKQGRVVPWRLHQNYVKDLLAEVKAKNPAANGPTCRSKSHQSNEDEDGIQNARVCHKAITREMTIPSRTPAMRPADAPCSANGTGGCLVKGLTAMDAAGTVLREDARDGGAQPRPRGAARPGRPDDVGEHRLLLRRVQHAQGQPHAAGGWLASDPQTEAAQVASLRPD